jgi:aldose sugar dehydrogenase
MRRAYALLALPILACNAAADEMPQAADDNTPPDCRPIETSDPNGRDQTPAFPGQTRACEVESDVAFEVHVIATGLEHPWSVEPMPNGDLLVTERPGRMRIIGANGTVHDPLGGLPEIDEGGQGGLLDVALSATFATDRTIFFSFTEPRQGGNGTSVARAALSADGRRLEQVAVIYRGLPTYTNHMHFGSRVVVGPDGYLYITMGERSDSEMRHYAQELGSHLGKIVRIATDGSAPSDNPFVGRAGAQPQIFSLGHRNVQAAAFDARGRLWGIEHGTRGGDELNLIEAGNNYGWPVQAYGIEYRGDPIAGSSTNPPGYEQPVYYWDPVIAPSGAQFYSGSAFPAWRGSLFVGSLGQERLVRLVIENDRVTGEEHLLTNRHQRIRDVRQGPDGALYIVTDEDDGELWRIAPN